MMAGKFGLLFPGQGAQAVGMGKDLAENFPEAKKIFAQADDILQFPLSKMCWEGPMEKLTRTEFCQPALYVTSMAALAALRVTVAEAEWKPAAAAGLSLGEYTALAAAGAFSFADGLKLVRLRGQAMEEASQLKVGAMASVLGLDLPLIEEACREAGAQVANINAPGQIVISGTPETVQMAAEKVKAAGAKRIIPLEVGGAFHSRLMEPAAEKLKAAAAGTAVTAPRFPVLSNVTGTYHTTADQIRALLVQQLTSPVRWDSCMRTMLGSGIKTYIEVGAGAVLKGLARKIDLEANVLSAGEAAPIRELALQLA